VHVRVRRRQRYAERRYEFCLSPVVQNVVHFAEGVALFCLYAFAKPALGALLLSSSSSGAGLDALYL
jgi:hypothetical protein